MPANHSSLPAVDCWQRCTKSD